MRPAPTLEQLRRYADGFNSTETMKFLGVTIGFPTVDRLHATLPVQPGHRGGMGTRAVNGGILSAVFDLVIGSSGALADPTKRTATIQLSMSFERPVDGDVITAEAWIDRAGTSTIFSSAVIRDGSGQICARCQGVLKISRVPWAAGDNPGIN